MDQDDVPMPPASDKDDTQPSAPQSHPAPVPPSPPPPAPLATLPLPTPSPSLPLLPPIPARPHHPADPQPQPQPPDTRLLPSFAGPLDAAHRAALRQKKWPLILLLPTATSASAPSSPTRPRPAWGPDAFHQPKKLFASNPIVDNILLWRRTAGSSDADRYTAFFPTDGLPHLALLDPRSGERLCVWGNLDGHGMDANGITASLWNLVQTDLAQFLQHHTLDEHALGPMHMQEKPWAVRTRRVAQPRSSQSLPPTSVMDDEDAAIAAAIAASLADAQPSSDFDDDDDDDDTSSHDAHHSDDDADDDDDDDDDDDEHSHDMFTGSASSEGDDDSNDSNTVSDDFGPQQPVPDFHDRQRAESPSRRINVAMPAAGPSIPPPTRRPVLIPTRGDPGPSSVESLSSSYLERMDSCFRSSTDAALMETRRLRQEQDAELAASLQEDREREKKERAEAEGHAAKKEAMLSAASRLPEEPMQNDECLVIAVRLPGGKRIMRRFTNFDRLRSVADFAIAEVGCVSLLDNSPDAGLRVAGMKLCGLSWDTTLGEMGLNSRTMFILNE